MGLPLLNTEMLETGISHGNKMLHALLENSNELTTVYDQNGIIKYESPSVTRILGYEQEELVNQSGFNRVDLEGIQSLMELFSFLTEFPDQTKTVEIVYTKKDGEQVLIESVGKNMTENPVVGGLVVNSRDITEKRKTEAALERSVSRINDSIRYARGIQNAIIPKISEIRKEIEGTSMLYLPKDTVSGDFPYFFKKGEYLYYAAVDCTGHGVPGAMLSLVGFLLLNDILKNSDEPLEPGEVLTKLHEAIVDTLNQNNEEIESRDGMDVSMCRLSADRKEVLYAGANRPLYKVGKDGELEQFKGDKFPVGGTKYRNRSDFSTIKIDAQQGDHLYFFSDGLQDQFGGQENRKLGPKRMREIFKTTTNTNSLDDIVSKKLHEEFVKWKGNLSQVDDILVIGLSI